MHLKKFVIPLISLFFLTMGGGFFSSLIPVRLHADQVSSTIIGLIGGAFFFGLVLGAFRTDRYIIDVGHIRAFAAFASLTTIVTLLHGQFVIPILWIFLRLIGGFSMAALYVVIESWLLVSSTPENRGLVLSFYMVVLYAAQSIGQFFLNIGDLRTMTPYVIIAILSSISVIPLALSKVPSPIFEEPSALSVKQLLKRSPSGFIGCFASGLVLGSIYSLLPLYIAAQMKQASDVSVLMASTILGGMFLQYPVGHLSDRIERRIVLIGICLVTILTSLAMTFVINYYLLTIITLFIFGGMTYTIYPVSISYACDSLDQNDIIAGTQGLLLSYSCGATIGPLLASFFMSGIGNHGLFIFFITVMVLLTIFLSWRTVQNEAPPQEESFHSLPQTTPVMAELDPRGEE